MSGGPVGKDVRRLVLGHIRYVSPGKENSGCPFSMVLLSAQKFEFQDGETF